MKNRLKVLLADDEELIRRKVVMMLGDTFHFEQAATAREARAAAERSYDAILLDIVFPDGNGIEICREVKARDPHSTVIISSSMESVDAWNDAFRAGADGYLEKRELLGLDPRKIVLMVQNLVERNRLRRQAEETNQRQAELLSVLSHDVRAPFQTLLGTIELLKKNPVHDATRNIDTLYQCAKDQLAFINSLLEFLRLESGVVGMRRSPLDVNLPVNLTLQRLSVPASRKEISLDGKLQEGLPKVDADIARVSQLVSNLINNAIKFTSRGGTVKVTTSAVYKNGSPGVQISVEDTGVGVKSEDREKIFQRFHRGRDSGTEGETGSGLGLSICKEIVHLHGGTLEVSDNKPMGAVFRAWFPAPVSAGVGNAGDGSTETGSSVEAGARNARSGQLTNRAKAL
jgi:two-component system, sensor histidine kinase and response regulator